MGSVEKHGKGILNEGAFSHTETFALAIAMLCVGRCNALRWRLQCFALADAMLCVGGCNALRWRLQCFALAIAMLCVSFSGFICILSCLVTIYTCFEL